MGKLVQLSEEMINYLGSGEIIHSVDSFFKELIENAVDAGATRLEIRVITLKNDIKKIVIKDNGEGIAKSDFELLAARYCTSKLKKYEELKTIDSFGFRGEALNAISFNSLLTVISNNGGNFIRQRRYGL